MTKRLKFVTPYDMVGRTLGLRLVTYGRRNGKTTILGIWIEPTDAERLARARNVTPAEGSPKVLGEGS